jgi:hypothetical protein
MNQPTSFKRLILRAVLHQVSPWSVQTAHRFRVPVTFNIDVDRNGDFLPETLQLLRELKNQVV